MSVPIGFSFPVGTLRGSVECIQYPTPRVEIYILESEVQDWIAPTNLNSTLHSYILQHCLFMSCFDLFYEV